MTRTLPRRTALAFTGALLSLNASAADLNARDFFGAPSGTSLGVLYLPATRADDFHGPADSTGKAELKVNALAYRQVFSPISAAPCAPRNSSCPLPISTRACPAPPVTPGKAASVTRRSAAPCSLSTTRPRAPTAAC